MQNHITNKHTTNSPAYEVAADIGQKVLDVVQDGATRAGATTEKAVRKYPLAAVGVSLGTGVALGAIGYRLMNPKPRFAFIEKLGLTALGATVARAISRFF
jgi:hypothetical protein